MIIEVVYDLSKMGFGNIQVPGSRFSEDSKKKGRGSEVQFSSRVLA